MPEPTGRYSRADVAARNGRGAAPLWLIIKDSVYDVTNYLHQHPGGDVILEEAGRDATKAYSDIGHSSDANTVLAGFKIGEIVEEEKYYDANGKKKKRVVAAPAEDLGKGGNGRSCLGAVTCGLLG